MRKIEEAIEAVVEAVMRPMDVQDAVSGAIAENIAAFALDNSVPGPGQVCNSITHFHTGDRGCANFEMCLRLLKE